ncbi:MAG: energy-coupling factor transporter transmembrane protein EcfT [Helicobacteraceae bacterium]|jgi:cobalt/nickel transport system permease protein|nr:energy-coupling factor transporter transmembrane protein EcfT [Helicobacteraceae bacterium]
MWHPQNAPLYESRVIALAVYSVAVAPAETISLPMAALPAALLFFCNQTLVFKRLILLNLFMAVVVASLLLADQPRLALLIFARSNLVLLTALALFSESDPFALAAAFLRLHAPKKLTSLLYFLVKISTLIRAEFVHFRRALLLRGWQLRANLQSYRLIAGFLGALIIKSFARSEALGKTMRARGFDGRIYTLSSSSQLAITDYLLITLAAAAFIPARSFL